MKYILLILILITNSTYAAEVFGIKLGTPMGATEPTMAIVPPNPDVQFDSYFVNLTPKTGRVWAVMAAKKFDDCPAQRKAYEAIALEEWLNGTNATDLEHDSACIDGHLVVTWSNYFYSEMAVNERGN